MSDSEQRTVGRKAAQRAAMALVVFCGFAGILLLTDATSRYLWLKALHVVAVISWMAGMVYLPRLFVYHADALSNGEADATFKVMERRLLKVIMTPAMIISWMLGLWLAWSAGYLAEVWFLMKLAAVLGMTAMHGYLAGAVKRFASGENRISASRWRLLNEIPTVLMIAAVVLVVVKPW